MIHLIGHLLEGGYRAWSFLRLLDYLSVRAIGAAMSAFILMLVVMPRFIWYLHRRGLVDQMRDTGVPSAFDKAGTPVMGGAVMVGCILAACLVWCDPSNRVPLARHRGHALVRGHRPDRRPGEVAGAVGQPRHERGAEAAAARGRSPLLFVAFLASPWSPAARARGRRRSTCRS